MKNKITGCIYGLAIGDGFGFSTEFHSVERILERWPPYGLQEPEGNPIMVSDDTQMTLALGKALMKSHFDGFAPKTLERAIRDTFVDWNNSPENTRAPGMTCMNACEGLEKGLPWQDATIKGSKGCGANMRVLPVGLLTNKGVSDQKIGQIAQFQAVMTHAHPTALVASELTAIIVSKLLKGFDPLQLPDFLLAYIEEKKNFYDDEYLQDIWKRPGLENSWQFISKGWDESARIIQKVKDGLKQNQKDIDPCLITGEGWIAEEALATALLCFLYYPEEPVKVLRRAVLTAGDSDSIACIAGGFVGTHCGIDAFPQDWVERIEYQDELNHLIDFFL